MSAQESKALIKQWLKVEHESQSIKNNTHKAS